MNSLYTALREYTGSDAYPFHMPGHKRQVLEFVNPFSIDITEIDGFDNLHHPEGILLRAQQRAAELYGADRTYYLVNGSTCGILSAVSAAVDRGGEILLARNSHKAAYHGAYLMGLTTYYVYPQPETEWGINGGILPKDVDNLLEKHPNIQAVLITSPTYDGIVSDIEGIAEVVHQHSCSLIVDEAHGAHFGFHPYFPESALKKGADVVIHSLHKTLPSLTQTALLHVKGNRVSREKLERFLGIYQSSSPSYVFMAGMDECMGYLKEKGKDEFEKFAQRLADLRGKMEGLQRIRLLGGWKRGEYGIYDADPSKLILSVQGYESGEWLYQKLRQEYGLQLEMAAGSYALALTSLKDTEEGFERLEQALRKIDRELEERNQDQSKKDQGLVRRNQDQPKSTLHSDKQDVAAREEATSGNIGNAGHGFDTVMVNEKVLELAEALERERTEVLLAESEGTVSGEFLYLYPPGIPLLAPGEKIRKELLERIEGYRRQGLSLQGLKDYSAERIQIIAGLDGK